MNSLFVSFLIYLFVAAQICSSYKILVYSNLFGHSHVKMLGSVADILTDAGHNVTLLVSIIDENERGKYGVKKTKQFLFVEPDDSTKSFVEHMKEFQKDMWKDDVMSPSKLITQAQQFADVLSGQCNKVLSSTKLLEQIKAENYDLAIGEPFDSCPYAFFEAINIRAHVAVLSSNRFEHASAALGQPMASSYVPGGQSTSTEIMNIKERLLNTIGTFATSYLFSYAGDYQFKKAREVVNINRSWRQSMLEVFASLPDVTFIWKYENENDTFVDHLENVYLGSWLPQNELLSDPRLTLFVTHGGLASTLELSLLGKPCVMIPLFAEQNRNAAMLKRHGGVEVLVKQDLKNSKTIKDTIEKVMNTPSYRENAENLAEKLNNLPTDPREVLIKHVEFVGRFGKLPTLDNHGRKMSIFSYYLIDIILIFVTFIVFVIYVFYKFIRFIVRKCFGKNIKPKND